MTENKFLTYTRKENVLIGFKEDSTINPNVTSNLKKNKNQKRRKEKESRVERRCMREIRFYFLFFVESEKLDLVSFSKTCFKIK